MTEQNKNNEVPVPEEENTNGEMDSSFDLEDYFNPEPLMRKGLYKGRVSEVPLLPERSCISWKIVLDGNGGYMSDGETPVDGKQYTFFNWLAKASDKGQTTKGGSDKWQNKINMLKKFADGMQISMKNMTVIQTEIAEGNWIGLPVLLELGPETYQGVTSMKAQNMKRREEDID